MILRAVILFLLFMLVMAMLQKAFRPKGRSRPKALDRLRCPTCKRVNFSNTPARCERADCRYR